MHVTSPAKPAARQHRYHRTSERRPAAPVSHVAHWLPPVTSPKTSPLSHFTAFCSDERDSSQKIEMAKKLSTRAMPKPAPEPEVVLLKCSVCRERGDSQHFSDCTKCRENVCDDCCKFSIRKEQHVVLCNRCTQKCKDCAALKEDPDWGGLYWDCEECDKRCCKACIQTLCVETYGRKRNLVRKRLCPKCVDWNSSK